jgi:hypothetical protein
MIFFHTKIENFKLSSVRIQQEDNGELTLQPTLSGEETGLVFVEISKRMKQTLGIGPTCFHLSVQSSVQPENGPIELKVPFLDGDILYLRNELLSDFLQDQCTIVHGKFNLLVEVSTEELYNRRPCLCKVTVETSSTHKPVYDFSRDYELYFQCRLNGVTDKDFRTLLSSY